MNPLIAKMTGKHVHEDVPVVPGAPRSRSARERGRRNEIHRRTAAAMLGLGEAEDDSIIPDDAQEIEGITGPSGIRLDNELLDRDREAGEPDHPGEVAGSAEEDRLLTPRDALVAPDVTPQALEPIDPNEVPQASGNVPKFVQPDRAQGQAQSQAQSQVNPMDVLMGRTSNRQQPPEPEHVMTAESAQAAVNTMLNVGGASGGDPLKRDVPMPPPSQGNASKIMETFSRYGPPRTWEF